MNSWTHHPLLLLQTSVYPWVNKVYRLFATKIFMIPLQLFLDLLEWVSVCIHLYPLQSVNFQLRTRSFQRSSPLPSTALTLHIRLQTVCELFDPLTYQVVQDPSAHHVSSSITGTQRSYWNFHGEMYPEYTNGMGRSPQLFSAWKGQPSLGAQRDA